MIIGSFVSNRPPINLYFFCGFVSLRKKNARKDVRLQSFLIGTKGTKVQSG